MRTALTSCDFSSKSSDWQIVGHRIAGCLAKWFERQKCTLYFSGYILIVVTVTNALKALCMLLALPHARDNPIVTLGDALQSFLDRPDSTTQRACLLEREELIQAWQHSHSFLGKEFRVLKKRWFRAASGVLWGFLLTL